MRLPSSPAPFLRRLLPALALLLAGVALAQISVPTFGTRGEVSDRLVDSFMGEFRSAVAGATGLEVRPGALITAGIAGSLEPEFAVLIAELDGARYAVSGEVAASADLGGDPYSVNLIVVDAERSRSTDLITRPLDPLGVPAAAAELAAAVAAFTSAAVELPRGDAGLFVTSEPGEAQVLLDGIALGRTSQLDVAMLAPGRYQLELRKEGFLPETRTLDLRSGDTAFVNVVLTAISGGSIQVGAFPAANVVLDGVPSGRTPVTLPALPGTHRVTLWRDGFLEQSFEVLVRNYRVTRLEADLEPAVDPLVFWNEHREVLVYIDGELQPGAHAAQLTPGLHTFELVRGAETRRYLRAVPDRGAFQLDLESGELVPLAP